MKRRFITRFLGAVITVISAGASTADVSVEPPAPGWPTRISISGLLNWDNADQFIQRAEGVSNAVVLLNSEGGDLLTGLLIGRIIRQKKFATAVKRDDLCASVCGLVWLGGAQRFLEAGARIGFRAASGTSEPGSASLGAYLNEIGLPDRATKYITGAPSDGRNWLDHVQAEKLGIAISAWPSAAKPPRPPEGPSESLWYYDGSTLMLVTDGAQRKFYYETPEPELVAIGVKRGTLFFVGQQKGRAYRGSAIAFSRRCGAFPYSVRGETSQDNQTIVMRGKAPNLDGTCRLKSTWEATLTLFRVGQQSSPPVSTISHPPNHPADSNN